MVTTVLTALLLFYLCTKFPRFFGIFGCVGASILCFWWGWVLLFTPPAPIWSGWLFFAGGVFLVLTALMHLKDLIEDVWLSLKP